MSKTTTPAMSAQEAFLAAKTAREEALRELIAADPRNVLRELDLDQAFVSASAYDMFPAEARNATFAKHAAEVAEFVAKVTAINEAHGVALAINAMPADIRAEYLAACKPAVKPVVKTGTVSIDPKTASGKLLKAIQANPCTPAELLAMVVDRNGAPEENRLAALHKRIMQFKKDHGINVVLTDGKYSVA